MKTFKQFVKASKKPKVPTTVIDFGERGGKPIRDFNHIPASAIIDFDRKKPINEAEDSKWFSHHNENKEYGQTPREQSTELHNWQSNDALGEHTKAYSRYSADLNRSLLKSHQAGREHPKSYVDDLHHFKLGDLDKEVGEHTLAHKLHTYSGVGFDPQELASQHPEGHVHLPAYTSTSIDKDVARGFAATARYGSKDGNKHIIHFELPAGSKGKHIGNNSDSPYESEYMLPRKQTIKIHPNPQIVHRLGQNYHVHKATLVPEEK